MQGPYARLSDTTLLFVIGAQKAGTTWLFRALSEHPDCHIPVKEVHYFDVATMPSRAGHLDAKIRTVQAQAAALAGLSGPPLARSLERLRQSLGQLEFFAGNPGDIAHYVEVLTRGRREQRVVGDITPTYALLGRDVFRQLLDLSDDTRFVLLLRDPVDRHWSAIRMNARNRAQGSDDIDAFKARAHALVRSFADGSWVGPKLRARYDQTIERLEAAVPADRILYLFYEDLFTEASLARLAGFLGIGPIAADPDERVNAGPPLPLAESDAEVLYRHTAVIYTAMAAKFGDALPKRWQDRMAAYGSGESATRKGE